MLRKRMFDVMFR